MNLRILIVLLRSLIVNSAVLHEWNCGIGRPIAIIGNNAGVLKQISCLISPAPVFINQQHTVKQIKNEVDELYSQAVICELTPIKKNASSKTQEYIENMLMLGCFGNIGNAHTYAPVIFIAVNEIPEIVEKTALVINIGDSKIEEGYLGDVLELLPSLEDFTYIRNEITTLKNDRTYPLKAAAAFALPRLEALGRKREYDEILRFCDLVIQMDEFDKSGQGLHEQIEEILVEAISDNKQKKLRLPSVNYMDEGAFAESIFFTEDYIYISDKKFKDIFDRYIKLWGTDMFKSKLRDGGLIKADFGGYTSKMRFNMNGAKCEKRMIRICLNQLDSVACCLI